MADSPVPDAPEATAGDAPAQAPAPPLLIRQQYLKDLSFENPQAPDSFAALTARPQQRLEVNVSVQKLDGADNLYETALSLKGRAMSGETTLFIVEMVYAAAVEVRAVRPDMIDTMLRVDVPHTIFPFARQLFAEAVVHGGYPPILLPPVDFMGLFRRALERQRASGQAKAAPNGEAAPA